MKRIIFLCLLLSTKLVFAGSRIVGGSGGVGGTDYGGEYSPANSAAVQAAVKYENDKANFIPRDLYRTFNGKTEKAIGATWLHFCGEIKRYDFMTNGILVMGRYGPPMEMNGRMRFFIVLNFPYRMADYQINGNEKLVAHFTGKFIQDIPSGRSNHLDHMVEPIPIFDYETVWVRRPKPMQKKLRSWLIKMTELCGGFHSRLPMEFLRLSSDLECVI